MGPAVLRFGSSSSKTCCCSAESSNGCGSNGMAANRSMALSCSDAVSTPRLTRLSSVAREIPTSSSCRAVSGPFCRACTAASWRGPGFSFSGRGAGQGIQALGRTAQSALHYVPSVYHGGAVLRTVWDDRLDGLEPCAEGALFQKAHKFQQIGRQAGILGRGIVEGLQLCRGVCLCHLVHTEHNGHAGLVAATEGHQHHAAGKYPAAQRCRYQVG